MKQSKVRFTFRLPLIVVLYPVHSFQRALLYMEWSEAATEKNMNEWIYFLNCSMFIQRKKKKNNNKRSSEFLVGTIWEGKKWAFLKEVYSLGFILCFDRGRVYLTGAPSCLPRQRQPDLIHLHGHRNRGIIWDIVIVVFLRPLWERTQIRDVPSSLFVKVCPAF